MTGNQELEGVVYNREVYPVVSSVRHLTCLHDQSEYVDQSIAELSHDLRPVVDRGGRRRDGT